MSTGELLMQTIKQILSDCGYDLKYELVRSERTPVTTGIIPLLSTINTALLDLVRGI